MFYVHGLTTENKPLLLGRDTSLLLDVLLELLNSVRLLDVDFDDVTRQVLHREEKRQFPLVYPCINRPPKRPSLPTQ
jgi:hypothetical protein